MNKMFNVTSLYYKYAYILHLLKLFLAIGGIITLVKCFARLMHRLKWLLTSNLESNTYSINKMFLPYSMHRKIREDRFRYELLER